MSEEMKSWETTAEDADARAREEALDPTRSFLIEAPAGSGKTGLLVQRVLTLLAHVDRPERILAITFTRKAAAEMRERVLAALEAAERQDRPEETDEFRRRTQALAAKARAHAQAKNWDIASIGSRLRIQTIDAFCAWLVRRAPFAAGVAAGARLLEEETAALALYREAAARALATRDHAAGLIDRYGGDRERLGEDLARLLARRERLRGLLAEGQGEAAEAALREHITQHLGRLAVDLKPLQKDLLAAIFFAQTQLPEDHALQRLKGWPAPKPESLAAWRLLAQFCLTEKGNPRQRLDQSLGFPPKNSAPEAEEAKEEALKVLNLLRKMPKAVAGLAWARRLPDLPLPNSSKASLTALQRLLRKALAELKLIFVERGVADFTEVALAALDALGEPEAPSRLLLALDREIHHILVDEFQDTSALQIELLERLTAGWQAGDGHSLFLVGDPMQSIYRFRHANVGLFLAIRERKRLGDVPLETLSLSRNFRSRKGLVEETNERFRRLLPDRDALEEGRAAVREAVAARGEVGGVRYLWCHRRQDSRAAAEDARAHLEEVADWVTQASASGQVAVLVRSREHALPLLEVLRKRGIEVHAPDFDRLIDRPLIADLAALALALSHPADRTAWLGVLRAPWCGLDQADLHAMARLFDAEKPFWTWLLAFARQGERDQAAEGVSPEGRSRLTALLERLRPWVEDAIGAPLRERLKSAWLALGGPACARDERELADAERFFAWLERQDPVPFVADHERFLDALGQLRAAALAPPEAPVVVLTIHQAKGLEFPHVALVGLGERVRSNEKPLLLVSSLIVDGRERPLLAIKPGPGEDRTLYDFAWELLEQPRDHAERERLLYVGMTRARESLLVACELDARQATEGESPAWKPPNGTLAEVLWQSFDARTGPPFPPGIAAQATAARNLPAAATTMATARSFLRRVDLPPRETYPASAAHASDQAAARPRFDWAGEPARLAGVLFHRFAERIAAEPALQGCGIPATARAIAAAELAAAGLDEEQQEEALMRIEQALAAIAGDEQARWLFADHGGTARSEYELLSREADGRIRRHRIDRTFLDGEVRWVVDFKLGRHEGGDLEAFIASEKRRYREQLERYAALFAEEGRTIRLALYYPLLPAGSRLLELEPEPEAAHASSAVSSFGCEAKAPVDVPLR